MTAGRAPARRLCRHEPDDRRRIRWRSAAASSRCAACCARAIWPAAARDAACVSPGAVITRQRPGTAKGFVFLTLEDETGIANIIVRPDLFSDDRATVIAASYLLVEGTLQIQDGVTSIKAERFQALSTDGPDAAIARLSLSSASASPDLAFGRALAWRLALPPPAMHAPDTVRQAPIWRLSRCQCAIGFTRRSCKTLPWRRIGHRRSRTGRAAIRQ